MAYLMNGNKVSMPLANFANLPLDAKTVADSVSQALDTTILPMTARYVGLMIFCEAENNYYVFSKHDDGTGTGTLTSGILNSDFQPFNPSNAIASNTELGQVIIKLNGGIEVDPDGTIYIKGMSTTSTTDPTTGNTTDVFTLGGITITTVTDGGGNVISQTTDIPGGITGTTTTDPTTGETTTTGSIGGVTSITATDPSGNQYSKVGDKIVSGAKTDVTTTTTTDTSGNPVTTTVTTTQTPNGTKRVTQTDSVDPTSGNTITTVETVSGGSDGVDVGRSDGTITTTETDSTGAVVSTDTGDIAYNNGEKEELATKQDVDNSYSSILGGLGWDF